MLVDLRACRDESHWHLFGCTARQQGTSENLSLTPQNCRAPARTWEIISQHCRSLQALAQSPPYCFSQSPKHEVDVFPVLLLARCLAGCRAILDVGEPRAWVDISAQWEVVSSGDSSACVPVSGGICDRQGCCAEFLQQQMWACCFAFQWLAWVKISRVQVLLNQPALLSSAAVGFILPFYLFFSLSVSAQGQLPPLWQVEWQKAQLWWYFPMSSLLLLGTRFSQKAHLSHRFAKDSALAAANTWPFSLCASGLKAGGVLGPSEKVSGATRAALLQRPAVCRGTELCRTESKGLISNKKGWSDYTRGMLHIMCSHMALVQHWSV